MREMSCPQEPVQSFLATGNELFVCSKGLKAPAQGVFRKWAREEMLLTQTAPGLNSLHPAILPRRSNYSCSYSSNSTKGVACVVVGVNPLPPTMCTSCHPNSPAPPPHKAPPYRAAVNGSVPGVDGLDMNPAPSALSGKVP